MTQPQNPFWPMADLIAERVVERLRKEQREEPPVRPRLMSVEQAADYMGRTAWGIRHMISNGKLSAVRMDGRVFLDVVEMDRAIEAAKAKKEK